MADYKMLQELSINNVGDWFLFSQEREIQDFIEKLQPQSRIHSKEEKTSAHQFWWVFMLLTALLAIEWMLRKYNGEY